MDIISVLSRTVVPATAESWPTGHDTGGWGQLHEDSSRSRTSHACRIFISPLTTASSNAQQPTCWVGRSVGLAV